MRPTEPAFPAPVPGQPSSGFHQSAGQAADTPRPGLASPSSRHAPHHLHSQPPAPYRRLHLHSPGYQPPAEREAARAAANASARVSPAARKLATLAIAAWLMIPGSLLSMVGISYDGEGGNIATKIHIGTYLMLVAFVLAHRGPEGFFPNFLSTFTRWKLVSTYTICMVYVFFYFILVNGTNAAAFIIESLIMTGIVGYTLLRLGDEVQSKIFVMMLSILMLNAVMGIIESLGKFHFIKYTVSGGIELLESYFRSTALLGHPLTNAAITAMALMMTVMFRTGLKLRIAMILILFLGLLCFGGRTSFVMSLFALLLYSSYNTTVALLQGRFTFRQITGSVLVGIVIIIAVVAIVVFGGLGERILGNMKVDGSAEVRGQIWDILLYMTPGEKMMGVNYKRLGELATRVGLTFPDQGIENFWLQLFIFFGINGFVPFVIGFFAGGIFLWRITGIPGKLALVVFLVVATSNNSLANKNITLKIFMAFLIAGAGHNRHMDRLEEEEKIRLAAENEQRLRLELEMDRPAGKPDAPPRAPGEGLPVQQG